MQHTLFLSHNASDIDLVHEVKRRSAAVGISVYTYEDDVQAGVRLADKLANAIRACNGLVAVLTKASALRPAIQQEIGVAIALGKPVFALVEDGVDVGALTLLQGLEYIRLDLSRLVEALDAFQRSVLIDRDRRDATKLIAAVIIVAAVLYLLMAD